MTFSISTLATQLFTTANLQSQQANLNTLNEQLASGKQHDSLTDYAPVDAHNLMDFQNAITQRQAYLSNMQTVSTRLQTYDATMTDMENITQQAQSLASQNQSLDPSKIANIQALTQSYLQQMQDDLNQQVSGRYIYAGSRYSTPPVGNLTTLGPPTVPFTPATSPTLPDYDTDYTASGSLTINGAPTGTFKIGNTSISWSDLEAGSVTSVNVNGTPTAVTVTGLATGGSLTPTQLASNLQLAINQIGSQVSPPITDFSGLTASNTGAQVTVSFNGGSAATITPDNGGASGEITWGDSTDGTSAETFNSNAGAYAQDSVTVDTGYNVQYGVTSNDPGFQKVIAGLRLMNSAAQLTDPTAYSTAMSQANALLTSGLQNIQSTHTNVAGNINIMTQATATQNTDISNLQTQIGNIQQVDMTQIGTEITLLQTQLSASYSATASLIQESILKYL